jgi:hypothetical protein
MEIGVKLMKQMDGEPRVEKVCRHLSILHADITGRMAVEEGAMKI